MQNKQIDFDRLLEVLKSQKDIRNEGVLCRFLGMPSNFFVRYRSGAVNLNPRFQARIFDVCGYANLKADLYRFLSPTKVAEIEKKNKEVAKKWEDAHPTPLAIPKESDIFI